jgi:chemotaxis protein histidine kinase CheA
MVSVNIKDYHEEFIQEVENHLKSFQNLLKDLRGSEEMAKEIIPQIRNAILPIKGDSEASENQKFVNICNNLVSYLGSADG